MTFGCDNNSDSNSAGGTCHPKSLITSPYPVFDHNLVRGAPVQKVAASPVLIQSDPSPKHQMFLWFLLDFHGIPLHR